MELYYLAEILGIGKDAGSKARNDIQQIFIEKNLVSSNNLKIKLDLKKKIRLLQSIQQRIFTLEAWKKMYNKKGEYIFIQYPLVKDHFILKNFFSFLLKNNKVCLVIHDINSLRKKDMESFVNEIEILNKAEVVIVHNEKMKKFLYRHGLIKPSLISIELFDYLVPDKTENAQRYLTNKIVFAGNINKSPFVRKMKKIDKFEINLYGLGNNIEEISNQYIQYKGSFLPEILPGKLEGSFGLIWDGDELHTCSGNTGEYLKFNNPHKLSLYIIAELPIIVWEKAAVAEFVNEHQIGFTIKSILEIEERIKKLNYADYKVFIKNIKAIKKKIKNGFFTARIIEQVMYMANEKGGGKSFL